MPITLKEGDKAPDFTLPDAKGNSVSLSSLRGQRVVLYFYPKDDSPGCTAQACSFRDSSEEYEKRKIMVVGVSPDGAESHASFAQKYALKFKLLSDQNHEVATLYGVWGKRTVNEKTFFGMARATFIIDEDGNIMKIFPQVTPEGHAAEVLAAVGERT
jgi:thioredoxin-dependent peroxiredoxin